MSFEIVTKRNRISAVLLVAGIAITGCGDGGEDDSSGGCEPFGVYAQNRWAPLGTAVREEPNVLSAKRRYK